MSPFNSLNLSEAERLALLLEELGETQQIIGKILRHGYESYNPIHPSGSNREMLEKELGDVLFAIELMKLNGDIDEDSISEASKNKSLKIRQYLHHQKRFRKRNER